MAGTAEGTPRSTKVLFIMGHGASGTTILGNLLGELDRWVHVGELRTFWGEGLDGVRPCGCGKDLAECELWRAVLGRLGELAGSPLTEDLRRQLDGLHARTARVRNTLKLLWRPAALGPDLVRYAPHAANLYHAIALAAEAGVVVDSSKRTGDAALLRHLPAVEPFYVHLIRDPRAVAHSWRRRDDRNRAARTALGWDELAVLGEGVRRRAGRERSLLVRFEDFIANPGNVVEAVARMVGEKAAPVPIVQDGTVVVGPNHTVGGHWIRFSSGPVPLREDRAWESAMPAVDRAVVSAITLPFLVRYRYLRVRPRPPA